MACLAASSRTETRGPHPMTPARPTTPAHSVRCRGPPQPTFARSPGTSGGSRRPTCPRRTRTSPYYEGRCAHRYRTARTPAHTDIRRERSLRARGRTDLHPGPVTAAVSGAAAPQFVVTASRVAVERSKALLANLIRRRWCLHVARDQAGGDACALNCAFVSSFKRPLT